MLATLARDINVRSLLGSSETSLAKVSSDRIGDNLFDLFLWNGSSSVDSGINLTGGAQFFFGGLGVDRFSIRGIEVSAMLDPDNVTAFITGLTFVRSGDFTGTMTPLTVEVSVVPEPNTAFLLLASALGLAGLRRFRTRVD